MATATFSTSATRFASSVWAIALREFRSKYGGRRLGLFWAFVEPTAYVVVLSLLMTAMRSTTSPLGVHIAPFIAMGVMSYMLFNATEHTVRSALKSNKALLSFPRIKPIGVYAGRFLTEVITLTVVFTAMFSLFVAFDFVNLPVEPLRLSVPLVISAIYGFSAGIANACTIALFKPWENIYGFFARMNFFTSGVFFLADSMPAPVQGVLYFQPLLHLSEWVRSAWFGHFESRFLDYGFIASAVGGLLLLALLMERVFRKRVLAML